MKIDKNVLLYFVSILVISTSCTRESKNPGLKEGQIEYHLGGVSAFSEMINAGVKQLALSTPMSSRDMDNFIARAESVASQHDVLIYREPELIITDLFPIDIVKDQEVLLLYKGHTLEQYLTLKSDKKELESIGIYDDTESRAIARRFGRMLSYSPRKINRLISQNTSFRTMDDFGIRATNLFLYYKDLKAALRFYSHILGMESLASYDNAEILRIANDSYLILVDSEKGMHTSDEPKTVALALLTDQLSDWYDYLKSKDVQIKYDYRPKKGGPHDGFVIVDPEGYLLEFEKFKQHPENENFIPILRNNKTIIDETVQDRIVPDGLGFHSTITWLYYKDLLKMQKFYEDVLGLELVADQGWTKIYKSTNTGFIGLVDEKRGMHRFTKSKAVNVSFIIDDLSSWYEYVSEYHPFEVRSKELASGPDNKYKAFVGYDPEGYFMEFDAFFPHNDNTKLLKYLNPSNID